METTVKAARGGAKLVKGTFPQAVQANSGLNRNAEEELIKTALRIGQIDSKLEDDILERKDLQAKLKLTTVGRRLAQISESKKQLTEEKKELLAGMKQLMKFFRQNGIAIDTSKLKMIKQ